MNFPDRKIKLIIAIVFGIFMAVSCASIPGIEFAYKKAVTVAEQQPMVLRYQLASVTNDDYYAGNFLYISEFTKIIYWVKNPDGSVQRHAIPFTDAIKFYEEDRQDGIIEIPIRLYPVYRQVSGFDTFADYSSAIFRVPKGTIRYEYNLAD